MLNLQKIQFENDFYDISTMTKEDLKNFIVRVYKAKKYDIVKDIAGEGMELYGCFEDFGILVLPLLIASYRLTNEPKVAVKIGKYYKHLYPYNLRSSIFYVNMAQAYNMIEDYNAAKICAYIALRIEGLIVGIDDDFIEFLDFDDIFDKIIKYEKNLN
ncbi:MAG: hypothetical protein J6C13_04355 [Clostridia bacterium]|nr:hypothetical protein [Clostridia bacterium]